jgi:hypothetical protein
MIASMWKNTGLIIFFLIVFSVSAYAATRQEIESVLETARRDLRISIATEERIAAALDKLKKSGAAAPDIMEDYALYLKRVQAMVDENRTLVAKMEALNARYDTLKVPERTVQADREKDMPSPAIPEEQVVDDLVVLDRQLDGALAEFDEMLLVELDLIRAKSSERIQDLAGEAAAAAERLREKGIEIDADAEGDTVESDQGSNGGQRTEEAAEVAPEGGKETESGEDREDGGVTAPHKSRDGVEGSDRHPKNRYDPRGDDIVARQLREAAEKEADPELREKLWKEYEQYKENTGN